MATFTFEHTNRLKATHVHADTRNFLSGGERAYPNFNDSSDLGKSNVWTRHGYYAPHNRSWRDNHQVEALPSERVPDLIEFKSEDDWRQWQANRDRASSKYCASTGFRNAVPDLKLDGYARNPWNLYRPSLPDPALRGSRDPWPKIVNNPYQRGYFDHYHKELDIHRLGGYYFPRDPKLLVNEEDIMKYEYVQKSGPNPNMKSETLPAVY